MSKYSDIFTEEALRSIFPPERTNDFFEALFGDAEEGAYDIALSFLGKEGGRLNFAFRLTQRPGCCLRCNLTYGLPQVFSRHPIINVKGVVAEIEKKLGRDEGSLKWELLATRELSREEHIIPLVLS